MSVMTEQRQQGNRQGKMVGWLIIGAVLAGLWTYDQVTSEEAPPPSTNITDYLPTQADCDRDPTLMGC